MTPFEKATLNLGPPKEWITQFVKDHRCTRAEAKRQYNRLKKDEIWINDTYQVNVDYDTFRFQRLTHLSIKRLDKQPIHDWRHLQQIKNEIMGPEREALELYPAESRVLDAANQFHLWVVDEGGVIPAGYPSGGRHPPDTFSGAEQRPFDDA